MDATGSYWRGRLLSFALGSVFGALLSLVAVDWLTASELPLPAVNAASEMSPAADPSIVSVPVYPDPPVVETRTLTPPPRPTRRDVRRPAVPSQPQQTVSAPFIGSLQIDSLPQGARAFIDGRQVGVTPLVVTDLAVGSRAVRLEAEGYAPWSSAIRVIANRQTEVNAALALSREQDSSRP